MRGDNIDPTEKKQPLRREQRPPWLKVKLPLGTKYTDVKSIVGAHKLHTVCEDARCPNLGECWNRGTATFMILGDTCTRSCGFCAVKTGRPDFLDTDEPRRVADAARKMNLRHVVVTSVNRDELADGGAGIFADTISRLREAIPGVTIEVLIPDFKGEPGALRKLVEVQPDILNHNIETVPRLYSTVRPQAAYDRSLGVLRYYTDHGLTTKSGLMLGIGEQKEEIKIALEDLAAAGVEIVTLGQYLQPSRRHLPVDRWVTPEEFEYWKSFGLDIGFRHVESAPLVRSSYHAEEHV
ncbi:MAG: lipoyl synthase [Chlorobi bacterium]|nr:lipoyl synthase [Chlorobiota bacterium]